MTSQHSLEVVFLQRFAVHVSMRRGELCQTCECRAITYGDLVDLPRRDIAIMGPESGPLSPATDLKVGSSRGGTGRSLRLVAACVVSPEPNRSLTAWLPPFSRHPLIDCGPQPPPNRMEELLPERSTSGMPEAQAPTIWL